MVRSTATSCKYGLAVAASVMLLWQLPALAGEKEAKQEAAPPAPLVPKAVPYTLLPPASDQEVASWRQWQAGAAPAVTMPRPAETVPLAQPGQGALDLMPFMLQPAETPGFAQPRLEPEQTPVEATAVEKPVLAERRPPPVADVISIAPRPEAVKPRQKEIVAAIPVLPGRSPFRQAPFKSEIVGVPAEAPAPAKGSAVSRFFNNLLPGKKATATQVASTSEGSASPAGDNKAGQADAGTKTDKPPIKRFIDGIQFWKN